MSSSNTGINGFIIFCHMTFLENHQDIRCMPLLDSKTLATNLTQVQKKAIRTLTGLKHLIMPNSHQKPYN